MFSRSRKGSKGFGFGSSSTKDSQVNHLLDLGLVSPKAIQDPYRPGTATTTRTNNTWTDAPSFPEKST
ncbi:hypothetical protein BDP67DRAFT_523559 [Colletotrichum lupini]|nr:hypothetical protein BDP67DRAFT_523559 [Colletotrichum lupini]